MADKDSDWRSCVSSVELAKEVEVVGGLIAEEAGFEDERVWVEQAKTRIEPIAEAWGELFEQCLDLPERASIRSKLFRERREQLADSFDELSAQLVSVAGSGGPVHELLFGPLKPGALRKGRAPAVAAIVEGLEKRLNAAYVLRVLSEDPSYEPAAPAAEHLREACRAIIRVAGEPAAVDDSEAEALRTELARFAAEIRAPLTQGRALLEAVRARLDPPPG